MCFPFLAIRQPFAVGPWKLVSLTEALQSETWASDQFKVNVAAMLRLFCFGLYGQRVEHPTVVSRVNHGMTGEPPTTDERNALTATVAFCALDTNRPQTSGSAWDFLIVAEHLDYWEFPVSANGFVSLPSGRRVNTLHAATWSEEQPIIGPTVVSSIPRVKVNQATASMLHEALMSASADSKKLRTAIQFLVESWRNHSSVVGLGDWQFEPGAIICDQQTALEALLQVGFGRAARDQIVEKCCELIGHVNAMDPVIEECSTHLWGERLGEPLKDWAIKFTQRRNKTIHQGDALAGLPDDAEPGTMLREVVDMADWVLRDAIRAKAALISELPPGEALQDALASPSNSGYKLRLACKRAVSEVSARAGENL